mmetsp:Transcript_96058/g.180783  ORF Transcript_96058/g.180783 Transcript_96058/m.180783 type:complete len:137 (+) Transcript_96058:315-725(+)
MKKIPAVVRVGDLLTIGPMPAEVGMVTVLCSQIAIRKHRARCLEIVFILTHVFLVEEQVATGSIFAGQLLMPELEPVLLGVIGASKAMLASFQTMKDTSMPRVVSGKRTLKFRSFAALILNMTQALWAHEALPIHC